MLKQLRILLAISLGTTIIAIGMFFDNNKSHKINESSVLIENFDQILADLRYIEFSNQNDSTIIELVNDQWLLSNSDNFPVNTELLSKFFIQLREAKILEPKTNLPNLLYKIGLDDENKLKLRLKDDTGNLILNLDLGIYNYNIPGSYVKFADSNQSYLVSTNLSTDTSPFYWMPNDLINIGPSNIKNVQIYNNQMINLENENGLLVHKNQLPEFSEISDSKIEEIQRTLTDIQHNGYILRSNLPSSPNFSARFTFTNNVVLFMKLYDIPEIGIHVTFDWNYLNDEIEISKFIELNLSGDQFQLGSLSLLNEYAFNVPQIIFDNLNIKLREKTE